MPQLNATASPVLTDDTLKWLSTRVKPHMNGDVVLAVKAAAADQTFEGPLACGAGQNRSAWVSGGQRRSEGQAEVRASEN